MISANNNNKSNNTNMLFTNGLLSRFPKLVPSYEKVLNKKEPDASIFSIIPKGLKSYLWFTYIEDKNVCNLLTLDNKKKVNSIHHQQLCFNSELSIGQYGTILYGTSFYTFENGKKIKCFSCENIIYYKGCKMEWDKQSSFLSSTELVDLFTCQIKQVLYNKNFIICGLPIMTRDISDAYKYIRSELPYKVYGIQQRSASGQVIGITIIRSTSNDDEKNGPQISTPREAPVFTSSLSANAPTFVPTMASPSISGSVSTLTMKTTRVIGKVNSGVSNKNGEVIFKVCPAVQPDIYELYCNDNDNKTEVRYGIAMIPTYKSSVFMNKLFRKIKENDNLDLLEESDYEEEFQDNRENKFVNLEKHIYMNCVFNKKFNKWEPVKVVDNGNEMVKLITKKDLLAIEQRISFSK